MASCLHRALAPAVANLALLAGGVSVRAENNESGRCNEDAMLVFDASGSMAGIVVVTDGEETCGGSPCDLGKELHGDAAGLTVHVIAFRMKDFSWAGEQSIIDAKCLAEANGGLYVTADAEQELTDALAKTLGCPMLSRLDK